MSNNLNFTMDEFFYSDSAKMLNYDNFPTSMFEMKEVCNNLMRLTILVLQPLRDAVGKPVQVLSGFRCPKVNDYVGGVKTSQHLTGNAVDIKVNKCTPEYLANIVHKLNLPYDQMICESGWLHISLKSTGNRKQFIERM